MSSNHKVDVFVLNSFIKHPNADTLSLIKIADTEYTYVARTADWEGKIGSLVAWVPPDSVVSLSRPEFSFLEKPRIRAKKLRGIISYGLLVPAPPGLNPGDDAAEALEVTHYEPPLKRQPNQFANTSGIPGPDRPSYDIDNFLRFGKKVFVHGEMVYISEKIHGACARYMFDGEKLWCGSRHEWKSEYDLPSTMTLEDLVSKVGDLIKATSIYERISKPGTVRNMWWGALPDVVKDYCINNPGATVYGEVYGNVQDLKYGASNEVWFRAFDVLRADLTWMDADEFIQIDLPKVPVIEICPFDFDKVLSYATGQSTLATHIREGVVIKPIKERWDQGIGRVSLKCINPAYLEKS